MEEIKKCSVDGCEKAVMAKGLCSTHYVQQRRASAGACSAEGCSNKTHAAGLCMNHYMRGYLPRIVRKTCPIDGCTTKNKRGDLCAKHREAKRKHGDPLAIWKRPEPKPIADRQGYLMIWRDGKRTFMHRIVMEQKLGRPLTKGENVHHINGDKADNRPENLELWSKVQPCGQRVVDKVAHALAVLEDYLPRLKVEAPVDAATIQAARAIVDRLRSAA